MEKRYVSDAAQRERNEDRATGKSAIYLLSYVYIENNVSPRNWGNIVPKSNTRKRNARSHNSVWRNSGTYEEKIWSYSHNLFIPFLFDTRGNIDQ